MGRSGCNLTLVSGWAGGGEMYLVVRTLGDFNAARQQPQLRRGKLRGVE